MSAQVSIAPPNSLVLVSDAQKCSVPTSMNGGLFASTSSCIAVGSLAELEGETSIILERMGDLNCSKPPSFVGVIDTPSGSIVVTTIFGNVLLELPVPHNKTSVKIWTNHNLEPDEIVIGVD